MNNILLIFSFLSIATTILAQNYNVEGRVIDSRTKKPLAFVSIVTNNEYKGGTTDIDGNFKLYSNQKIHYLKLNYVGYTSKTFPIENNATKFIIELEDKQTEIDEVNVYPLENPAHRIINLTVENRKINDPEKQHSFSYNSYNKFIVTATNKENNNALYIKDTVNFLKLIPDTIAKIDSNQVAIIQPKDLTPSESLLVNSLLEDPEMIYKIADSILSDSLVLLAAKMGLVFVYDNPDLLKKQLLEIDSTINTKRTYNAYKRYFEEHFTDSITKNLILEAIEALVKSPKGMQIILVGMNKIMGDSAISTQALAMLGSIKTTQESDSIEMEEDFDFEKQHLFLMESITKKKFLYPDNLKENVLANRVSGLKNPLFVLVASQIQSFSFYNSQLNIGNKTYVNPISKGSTKKYFFHIEDTIYSGVDSVFIISFQPKRNTNFEALQGVLYINTNTFAVQNVIASSARQSVFQIKIQQKYEFIDNTQWFPVQLNTEVTIESNISITSDGEKSEPIGSGKTYITNIQLNPELKRRNFDHIVVDMDEAAGDRKSDFWEQYRASPLDDKDLRTYEFMDSVGKEVNIEKYTRSFFILKSGFLPVKFINIDIKDIIRGNEYEGLRVGLAAQTNYKLSKWMKIGGYFAYGTNDNEFKYGGNTKFFINKRAEFITEFFYAKDVSEFGVKEIYEDNSLFSDAYWRSFLYRNMAHIEQYSLSTEFRALRYLKLKIGVNHWNYFANNTYPMGTQTGYSEYNLTEASLGIRYSFKEKIINTPQKQFMQSVLDKPILSKYPVVWFEYTSGIDFLGGEHLYQRFDIKIEKSFTMKYLGTSSFKIEGGYINSEVPFVRLYNARASYRLFTIDAPNSFSTMRMDEFYSDQYTSLFFNHNFGKLLIRTKRFTPEFNLSTSITFGKLDLYEGNQETFNTLEKGYYESGIQIAKLLNLKLLKIGIGLYYRYGEYAFTNQLNNFSFRFSLHSPL